MSATHADRHAVYESLEPLIGEDAANRLMDLLPTYPERELVTRTDMHATATLLRGEMAELRSDLRGEMAELRSDLSGEMAELRSELSGEMSRGFGSVRSEIADVRTDLAGFRTEVSERFERNQQWLIGVVAANLLAIVAAALAVVLALV